MIVHETYDGKKFHLSYQELRGHYYRFVSMKDEEFRRNLPDAAHFACVVCWLKEVGPDASIGDTGIVHQLIHLMTIGDDPIVQIKDVRKQFKKLLFLD